MTIMKRITQIQFDEAVTDMIEGLGLEEEEAIQSVVEEFEMQGVDLKGIIKAVGGNEALENAPSALAAKALKEKVSAEKKDLSEIMTTVEELKCILEENIGKEEYAQSLLASAKFDGVESLLRVVDVCKAENEENRDLLLQPLETVKIQLEDECGRDQFCECSGSVRLMNLLNEHSSNQQMTDLLLQIAAVATKEQEENKCNFMSDKLPELMIRILEQDSVCDSTILIACQVIKSLLTADDARPTPQALEATFGGEFNKALSMDNSGMTATLMRLLEDNAEGDKGDILIALCQAMRKISLNDEICKKFVERGSISIFRSVLKNHPSRDVVLQVLLLMKQLSACDLVKSNLIELEAIDVTLGMFSKYSEDKAILLPLLYLLTNLTLRNPGLSEEFSDVGGIECILEVIKKYKRNAKLMKQVCMLVRNIAVRSARVKAALVKVDMESKLRFIQEEHSSSCVDVASAALRDMGIENYKIS